MLHNFHPLCYKLAQNIVGTCRYTRWQEHKCLLDSCNNYIKMLCDKSLVFPPTKIIVYTLLVLQLMTLRITLIYTMILEQLHKLSMAS